METIPHPCGCSWQHHAQETAGPQPSWHGSIVELCRGLEVKEDPGAEWNFVRDCSKSDRSPGESPAQEGIMVCPASRPSVKESPTTTILTAMLSRQRKADLAWCPASLPHLLSSCRPARPCCVKQSQQEPVKAENSLKDSLKPGIYLQSPAAQRLPAATSQRLHLSQGPACQDGAELPSPCPCSLESRGFPCAQPHGTSTSTATGAGLCYGAKQSPVPCTAVCVDALPALVSALLLRKASKVLKCLSSARAGERQVTLEESPERFAKMDLFLIPATRCKAFPSIRVTQHQQTSPRPHLLSSSGTAGTPFCPGLPWDVCSVARLGIPEAGIPSLHS